MPLGDLITTSLQAIGIHLGVGTFEDLPPSPVWGEVVDCARRGWWSNGTTTFAQGCTQALRFPYQHDKTTGYIAPAASTPGSLGRFDSLTLTYRTQLTNAQLILSPANPFTNGACTVRLNRTEPINSFPDPGYFWYIASSRVITVTPSECGWDAGSGFSDFRFMVSYNVEMDYAAEVHELLIGE